LEGLDAEKVTRFGVVLVGEEGLEGECRYSLQRTAYARESR
jgi:hypothetical protein